MICVLQFDAASVAALDRLLADGRLPNLAALLERGRRVELETPAADFAAGAFYTLYSGVELGDHGIFYPFQWSAAEQRARYATAFDGAAAGLGAARRVGPAHAGDRSVREPAAAPRRGRLRLRLGLRRPGRAAALVAAARTPAAASRAATGAARRRPRSSAGRGRGTCSRCARSWSRRPGRIAALAEELLARERFDLAWLTFSAAHLAGHQFWDLSQLDATALDPGARATARDGARRRLRRRRRRARPGARGAAAGRRRDRHLGRRHGREHEPRRPAARDARPGARRRPGRRRRRRRDLAPARGDARRPARRRSPARSRTARRSSSPPGSSSAGSTGRRRGPSPTRPTTRATCGSTFAAASATGSSTRPRPTPCWTRSPPGSRRSPTPTAPRRSRAWSARPTSTRAPTPTGCPTWSSAGRTAPATTLATLSLAAVRRGAARGGRLGALGQPHAGRRLGRGGARGELVARAHAAAAAGGRGGDRLRGHRRGPRWPTRGAAAAPAGLGWVGEELAAASSRFARVRCACLQRAPSFPGLEARKVGFRGIGALVAELSAPRHPYPAPPTSRPPPPPRWPPGRPRPAPRRPRPSANPRRTSPA